MAVYSSVLNTPLGRMRLDADDSGLIRCQLTTDALSFKTEHPVLKQAHQEILSYFEGHLQQFSTPLAPQGTSFQKRVWQALCRIPYGTTCAYKDIAKAIDQPKAMQAVGSANKHNPIMLIIPCHRVIQTDGYIGGYAHGQAIKRWLLDFEISNISN